MKRGGPRRGWGALLGAIITCSSRSGWRVTPSKTRESVGQRRRQHAARPAVPYRVARRLSAAEEATTLMLKAAWEHKIAEQGNNRRRAELAKMSGEWGRQYVEATRRLYELGPVRDGVRKTEPEIRAEIRMSCGIKR